MLGRKNMMRHMIIAMTSVSVLLGGTSASLAQVAGSTQLGVATAELRELTKGWSAKRQILGQPVYNNKDERVGQIEDIIVAPDKTISYAIVGAGGFLGLGKHDVAIPVNQLKLRGASSYLRVQPETRSSQCQSSNTHIRLTNHHHPPLSARIPVALGDRMLFAGENEFRVTLATVGMGEFAIADGSKIAFHH
jgi:hypothetical protein